MVTINYDSQFHEAVSNLDNSYKIRVKKQIKKIISNPLVGKPMKHNRKGTREVYISPFRLSNVYDEQNDTLLFLDVYHKDKQ